MCRIHRRNARSERILRAAPSAGIALDAPPKTQAIRKVTDPTGEAVSGAYGTPTRGCPEPFGATIDPRTVSTIRRNNQGNCHRLPLCLALPHPFPSPYTPPDNSSTPPLFKQYLQGATNFALFSANATGVTLCLFTENDLVNGKVTHQLDLSPKHNRTGDVWHVALPDLDATLMYGYVVKGDKSDGHTRTAGQAFDMVSCSGRP